MTARGADLLLDIWQLHRRAVTICVGGVIALLLLLGSTALVVRAGDHRSERGTAAGPDRSLESQPAMSATPASSATDVAFWDAIQPVVPATSQAYPAISSDVRRDPSAYAAAFATELFSRDYANDRNELIAWAQYEDSPLQARNYPRSDWSKILVNSLTDLSWDDAADTPIPAEGPWLALRSQRGLQSVTRTRVTLDEKWEQLVAGGYQPPDPQATVRDVSLVVVQRTTSAGHDVRTYFDVSIAVQLGTSPRGGYGVAATNNYAIREAAH